MTKTWVKNALIALLSTCALAVAYQVGIYNAPIAVKTIIQFVAQSRQACVAPIAAKPRAVARRKRHYRHHYECVKHEVL